MEELKDQISKQKKKNLFDFVSFMNFYFVKM